MTIDEANKALMHAREKYHSAVDAYRIALNPTKEELEKATPRFDLDEYHGGLSREDLIRRALNYEEDVLDKVLEHRANDEGTEQSAAKSA